MTDLKTKGWMLVEGISSPRDLLELGKSLGKPVPTPNGELVKEIRRVEANAAQPGSQSAMYGAGRFPLHTDTVFWPQPVRYVLLRGYGDTRRPTTVLSLAEMIGQCDVEFRALLRASVWRVLVGRLNFYCSLIFQYEGALCCRYDADLMHPANAAASKVQKKLIELVQRDDVPAIRWTGSTAVILSNWTALHGRGPQPPNEGVRIVERLYVR